MDNRKKFLIWLLGTWFLATPLAGFGEAGSARLRIDIREQPSIDSKVVINIRKKQKLEIVNRLGSWVQVKTEDNDTGWLRLHRYVLVMAVVKIIPAILVSDVCLAVSPGNRPIRGSRPPPAYVVLRRPRFGTPRPIMQPWIQWMNSWR